MYLLQGEYEDQPMITCLSRVSSVCQFDLSIILVDCSICMNLQVPYLPVHKMFYSIILAEKLSRFIQGATKF